MEREQKSLVPQCLPRLIKGAKKSKSDHFDPNRKIPPLKSSVPIKKSGPGIAAAKFSVAASVHSRQQIVGAVTHSLSPGDDYETISGKLLVNFHSDL